MPDLSDLQRLGQEFDADGVEAVARACADDPGARLIAGKSETVCQANAGVTFAASLASILLTGIEWGRAALQENDRG